MQESVYQDSAAAHGDGRAEGNNSFTMSKDLSSIEPADCYLRARTLLDEVDLIRQEMGRRASI